MAFRGRVVSSGGMVDGFVSASEVAFVVREYLRQEGFERTLSAFRDEAAHLLSAVAAVRGRDASPLDRS